MAASTPENADEAWAADMKRTPPDPVEVVATAIRHGQPHDGSDLDVAVDEDARQIVAALHSAGLLAPALSDTDGTTDA